MAPAPVPYPAALRSAEHSLLTRRRILAGIDADAPLVGLALSGGGIRSATFCLGLLQALARQRLLRRIDLLSTVSGGGYCGGFLGGSFNRGGATVDSVEQELADNHSWPVSWLRDNGRYLSPNGSGDNWTTAAVMLRNWVALHVVLLTFGLLILSLAALVRADLGTQTAWLAIEQFFWTHSVGTMWFSPWFVLPAATFVLIMVPTGSIYWMTQLRPFMHVLRSLCGRFSKKVRRMADDECASAAQGALTRMTVIGLVATASLLVFATIDSLGQMVYLRWSDDGFRFPTLWAMLTTAASVAFATGSRAAVYIERLMPRRAFRVPLNAIAFALAFLWLALIVVALSVVTYGLAWRWDTAHFDQEFVPMSGGWPLVVAVLATLFASWFFSRSFGFVNLSSLQQLYAARLGRAYLGASNPERRRNANYSMTALLAGDDVALADYAPHENGGPLHYVNVTVNETLSGRTQIERRDRKGVPLAIGPCGMSVGTGDHSLWADNGDAGGRRHHRNSLWEIRTRGITPIRSVEDSELAQTPHGRSGKSEPTSRVEALSLRHWVAISGAAFTTGTGATTCVGLSLLLGLANVRLGYWWDSGVVPHGAARRDRANFLELGSRIVTRILPVQSCLMTEFFARFHGPARRHWYLSDGGHFENTAVYELLRRRVPFIICSDAGQDAGYAFGDVANLIRKARTDFGAEIQFLRHTGDESTDDPGVHVPLPTLEQVVHPALLDIIGTPDDFGPLRTGESDTSSTPKPAARRHALLARVHYTDGAQFSWLLVVKPSLAGDETQDLVQYQRAHPDFPQEPTTDQYFDEAQWESYRKLGEHIGAELFTPPVIAAAGAASWTPSRMAPPEIVSMPVAVETRGGRRAESVA
jgi:hypothetical protein